MALLRAEQHQLLTARQRFPKGPSPLGCERVCHSLVRGARRFWDAFVGADDNLDSMLEEDGLLHPSGS